MKRNAQSPIGVIAPDLVEVKANRVVVEGTWSETLAVTGYPREVGPGWLDPLFNVSGRFSVSVHIEPVGLDQASTQLRKQRSRLESSRQIGSSRGRLNDPGLDAAASDAEHLAGSIARGEARLFRVGILVTARGETEEALGHLVLKLRTTLSSLLADLRPIHYRSFDAWVSSTPLGIDRIGLRRTFDTASLAATYPVPAADFATEDGILYGKTQRGSGLVLWDRFTQDNFNSVILARSGSGKSHLAKLEVLRSLYKGIDVSVIDPEDEYRTLAQVTEGISISLGSEGVCINPFDLGTGPDPLTERGLFLHTLINVLLGERLTSTEASLLDSAIVAAYQRAGITSDPRTHRRVVPVLADFLVELRQLGGQDLAQRLDPFVTGTYRRLFESHTTVNDSNTHLVVYSLKALSDEIKTVGTLLALDRIWNRVRDGAVPKRRMVTVDEAWLLMRDPEGAKFLFRLAKSARKYWCGLTIVTQDAGDVLSTELGKAVVANAATQILMRQAPQAIDAIAESFKLSEGERQLLLSGERGTGILSSGTRRVAFKTLASEFEHSCVTTDPAELNAISL